MFNKNPNFGQKSKFWARIKILPENRHFRQQSIFCSRINILVNHQNFGQTIKIWSTFLTNFRFLTKISMFIPKLKRNCKLGVTISFETLLTVISCQTEKKHNWIRIYQLKITSIFSATWCCYVSSKPQSASKVYLQNSIIFSFFFSNFFFLI